MRQPAAALIHEENTDVVAAVCLQRPGSGIGHIAHLICNPADPLSGFSADILLLVECFADRGNGHAASRGYVFQRNHRINAFQLNRLRI